MRSDSFGSRITRLASTGLLLTLGVLFALPATAVADEWLDRANKDMGLVTGNKSVEEKLFPLLLEMDPFPFPGTDAEYYADPLGYMYIPRSDPRRERLMEWAQRPAQVAVIEAIEEITDESDKYMFSIQIGRDKVPAEWAEAGLLIESGYQDLLALLEYPYFDSMIERLDALFYASGIAKAEAGEGDEALLDHARFLLLSRMLLNRPSAEEKRSSAAQMAWVCNLMTDLVYQYTRPGDSSFTAQGISDAILETDEQFLGVRQAMLPTIDFYSARQFFDKASQGRDRIDPGRYAVLMAMVKGENAPSRFGFAAAYRSFATVQADRIDFENKYNDLVADFTRRWNYSDLHDPYLRTRPVARDLDPTQFDALDEFASGDILWLFRVRLQLLTDLSGMRCALGTVAFYLDNRNLPGRIVAIQPEYVRTLNNNLDYMHYDRRIEQSDPLSYWVPIRDERFGQRETPMPYPIRVIFSQYGRFGIVDFARPASRGRDLMRAIPFPGFSEGNPEQFGSGGDFSAGDFGGFVGLSATSFTDAVTAELLQALISGGTIEQFGLSQSDHVAFEEYIAGESDSFDFNSIRELLKRSMREEGITEQEAQQLSVVLAGLPAMGFSLDTAAEAVREQLESYATMTSGAMGGNPEDLGMTVDSPAAAFLAMGDLNEAMNTAFGKSPEDVIDHIVGLVEQLASVPSLRSAVDAAAQGEFLTGAEAMSMMDDLVDVLVTRENVEPLRQMLTHFRETDLAESMMSSLSTGEATSEAVFAIDGDSFLLYSVWHDGRDDRAALIEAGFEGDMLYWPPAFSLYREYRNR